MKFTLILSSAALLLSAAAQPLHAAAPSNDNFENAIALSGTYLTVTGSNLDATKQPGEPDHGANPGGKSVWWSWTAPGAGSVIIETTGSTFDTLLAAYSGATLASLKTTRVASNDDVSGNSTSMLGFDVTAGTVYRIAVDGYGDESGAVDSGEIHLTLTYSPAPLVRPANDNFANRIPLAGVHIQTIGTNLFASLEAGEPLHAGAPGGASVWWSWTTPVATDVIVDTAGSNMDTSLAVYTGLSVDALTLVAQNDDVSPNQPQSRLTFRAAPNTPYQIAVDGYDGEPGRIQLELIATETVALDLPRRLADGRYSITVTGKPGQSHALEASTDLRTWDLLQTLTNLTGAVEFIDPMIGPPHRSYRAR